MNSDKRNRESNEEPIRKQESIKKQCLNIEIEELTCPITREIFNRPVTADDGFTYEKWAIDKVLYDGDGEAISPITREDITSYYENKVILNMVTKLLEVNEDMKEDQFDANVYNDFLQNTDYFIKMLNDKNFNKFKEATSIRLNHFAEFKIRRRDDFLINKKCSIIQYLCLYVNCDSKTFEQILKNSFDLNCPNCRANKPIHYIAKNCELSLINIAVNMGTDFIDISNNLESNFIKLVYQNNNLSDDDKQFLMNYLFTNNQIIPIFNNYPKCILDIETYGKENSERFLNTIIENEESVYQLVDLENLNQIMFEITYDDLDMLLNYIERMNYDATKLCRYYEHKHGNSNAIQNYCNGSLQEIYRNIKDNPNFEDDDRVKIMKRISEFCHDKLQINNIDEKLFELNVSYLKKDIDYLKNSNEEEYNKFVRE